MKTNRTVQGCAFLVGLLFSVAVFGDPVQTCASLISKEEVPVTQMKAVGYFKSLPITESESLLDLQIAAPSPGPRDLLVRVHAVSVNPVDTKQRKRKAAQGTTPVILGWDVSGVVEAVGPGVVSFKVGDAVYYAGDINRNGGNSELHAIDERLVAPKPRTLDFAQAAALPLTALTAYEGLFERLGIDTLNRQSDSTLLVIGGAGGVGSLVIQMARIAGLKVIATASRPETAAWVRELGATAVIDHRQELKPQLEGLGVGEVDYIFNTADTAGYWDQMAVLIKPFGKITSIVETKEPVDLTKLMAKAASFHWELMFTRSLFQTPDMARQGEILGEVANWVDEGKIRHTVAETLSPISAANLKTAHALLESQKAKGKIVLSGW